MKHTLLAGPWVGSIHGELMCWQGWLRQLSRNYNRTIIICPMDRRFLYRDFATSFIDTDSFDPKTVTYTDRVTTKDVPVRWVGTHPVVDSHKFMSYAKGNKSLKYYATFHAKESDHLSRKDWAHVVCMLPDDKDVAWAADYADDCYAIGGNDLRFSSLTKVYNAIVRSKIVVGPCNSIVTLSALSEVPFVTWMDGADDPNIFADVWNPFSVPAMVFRSTPNVYKLMDAINKLMDIRDEMQRQRLAVNQE